MTKPTSIAYYRIPGVATSAATSFEFSSTEAKTERQCVDFCATHSSAYPLFHSLTSFLRIPPSADHLNQLLLTEENGGDFDMTYRLSPTLCTCSATYVFADTAKVPGTVTLSSLAYGFNICNQAQLSQFSLRPRFLGWRDDENLSLMTLASAQIPTVSVKLSSTAARFATVRSCSSLFALTTLHRGLTFRFGSLPPYSQGHKQPLRCRPRNSDCLEEP